MKTAFTLILIAIFAATTGCSTSIDGRRYLDQSPTFVLEEFFSGQVKAWGIVQNRSGNVVQRFEVDIDGTWEDNTLTLDETFRYMQGDGVKHRIWTIQKTPLNSYTGRATDIEGPAVGTVYGNAVRWRYDMDLPVGDNTYRVHFDDWIWALDENRIINRSYIRKFGLTMAEVTIYMEKISP